MKVLIVRLQLTVLSCLKSLMVDPTHSKYVQLTHLPTLEEIHHEVNESTGERILSKAVALQLKPMNAEISKFAFDYLLLLIEDQLNDMIGFLHKSSNIQRRELIAKADLELFLEGFNLSPSDLDLQCQASQHYNKVYGKELEALHSLKETISDAVLDDEGTSQEVINSLVPPNNPLAGSVPKWMPALPPDHTYRFTPQYNHPITDETVIRRKIVDEGKQSEVALLHLLRTSDTPVASPEVQMSDADIALASEETKAIYGSKHKKRRKQASNPSDLLSKLPQTNFNVEEYARSRVELARRKVLEYEERQLQLQQNPFIKYSKLVLSASTEKLNRRQVNKDIHSMLKLSLYSLVKSIPKLQESKQEARRVAEMERDKRLQELRAQREEQERNNEQLGNGDINLLDLDNHSDDFFNYSGSDNDEQEPQETAPVAEADQSNTQPSNPLDSNTAETTQQPLPSTQEDHLVGSQNDQGEQLKKSEENQKMTENGNALQARLGEHEPNEQIQQGGETQPSEQFETAEQIRPSEQTQPNEVLPSSEPIKASPDRQPSEDIPVSEQILPGENSQQREHSERRGLVEGLGQEEDIEGSKSEQEMHVQQEEPARQQSLRNEEEDDLDLDNTSFLFDDNDELDGDIQL